jgi:hypothetical protein
MSVVQPKVTEYKDTDACRCDDYIVLPRETPLNIVIETAFKQNCHGFSRGSNTQGNGKFYIRSPHKTSELLKTKLKQQPNVSFFILE